jgi:Flp pilus assembly protein TadD
MGMTTSSRRWRIAALAGALGLVTLVYAGALAAPLLFDDVRTVQENPSIRDLANWRWVLAGSRRPLTNFSYAIDYALWSLAPFGYHLTNVLLHALDVALLFVFAGCAFRDARARTGRPVDEPQVLVAQTTAAALFAAHPLLTESVAYVSARAGLLCAAFGLGSLIAVRAWLVGRGRGWLGLGLALFALAVASKETAAVLPLVYLAYDRWLAPGAPAERRRRLLLVHAPLDALLVAGGLVRVSSYLRFEGGRALREPLTHAATQLGVFWRYLALVVFPVGQSAVHAVPLDRLASPWPWLSLAGLAAVTFAAWRARARRPLVAFGWTLWLVALAPTMAIPLVEHMAEHRVYEASAGLFLIAGAAAAALSERQPRALVAVAALALVSAFVARARVAVWSNPVALWSQATARAPDVWAPHYALGDALRAAGRCDLAVAEYRAAIRILDAEPRAHTNLAICLVAARRFDEARAEFDAALRLAPRDARVETDVGFLEIQRGRADEARLHLERAIALDADYLKPRLQLARLYRSALRDPAAAARVCDELRARFPDSAEAARCLDR